VAILLNLVKYVYLIVCVPFCFMSVSFYRLMPLSTPLTLTN